MEQPAISPEMWTMIAGFVGLAGLIFAMASRLDRRIDRVEDSIRDLRTEMNDRFDKHGEAIANLGDRVAGLTARMAGVEKALDLATDLLRDLLGRRNAPGAASEQGD